MTAQSPHPSIQQNIYPAPPPNPAPFQMPVALGQYQSDELDFGNFLKVLRRRWLIIGGVTLAVSGAIWSWTLTRTPIFRGEFRVLVESINASNPSTDLLLGNQSTSSTVDYGTQIEVLKSPVLLGPIAQALQAQYPNVTTSHLRGALSIGRLRDTKVLAISYSDPDAQKIKDVLDEVATQYLDYSFEQRQVSLQQGIQFVDDKLPELRDRVTTLQVRLERFRQQYSILDPEIRGNEISGLLASVESQRQSLQAELAQAQSRYQALQGQLKTTPDVALADAALSQSSRYQALLNQLQDLESEIAVQSARYQPNSPQIEALEEQRENLRPLLQDEANRILGDKIAANQASAYRSPTELSLNLELIQSANNVQELQARSRTLARIEGNIKEEFDLVPGLARQYTDLQRELGIATESLNRFLSTRETLQIDAAQKSVPWQLILSPALPGAPISPNVPRNLTFGVIAGLLVGSAAALLAEKLDQVFHSVDDLKQAIPLPLLGIIPYLAEIREQTERLQLAAQRQAQSSGAMFSPSSAHGMAKSSVSELLQTPKASMFLEAFRSLYTNVKFLGTDHPIHSLVISSAIPGEGKTTNAIYLARSAALMGQRVLLVDADLRAPKHHTYLNLTNIRGLSNAISEAADVKLLVQSSALDTNLSVLTAGPKPPDPIKLLSSKRMQGVMEELRQDYDLVIYDVPPLGFADSSLLAAHTDGMMLVVGLGQTERSVLARALDDLKISPVTILGMVANGIKSYTTPRPSNYAYYRYYGDRAAETVPQSPPVNVLEHEQGRKNVTAAVGAKPFPRPAGSSSAQPSSQPTGVGSIPSEDYSEQPGEHEHPSHQNGNSTHSYTPDSFASDPYDPNGYAPEAYTSNGYDSDAFGAAVDEMPPPPVVVTHSLSPLQRLQPWQWAIAGVAALCISSLAGWSLYSRILNPQPPSPQDAPQTAQPDGPRAIPDGAANSNDLPGDPQTAFFEAVELAQAALKETETATTAQDWSQIAKSWQDAANLMAIVPDTHSRYEEARERTITYRDNSEYARQRVLQLLQTSN